MKINNFYELEAWQKGKSMAVTIYAITNKFPKEELYGIISQLRRASVSVIANIAEGFSRYYYKDKIRFYYQARGSNSEVQCLILLSLELKIIDSAISKKILNETDKTNKLINGLIRTTRQYSDNIINY